MKRHSSMCTALGLTIGMLTVSAGAVLGQAAPAGGAKAPASTQTTLLPTAGEPWTGDFDGMVKRRLIRVLVVYNKTNYLIDRGIQRGITYEAFKKFEDDLNVKLKTGNLRVNVTFHPVSRDEIFQMLVDGRGDVAAANLTVTSERQKLVDFTEPGFKDLEELVVTGPGAPKIASVDDLSGQEVYVRNTSSYAESLRALNTVLAKKGRKPVVIKPAPDVFESEDILEMVNAGIVKITVVDDYLANFWKQIFPNLVAHPDVALRTGGSIAWASARTVRN